MSDSKADASRLLATEHRVDGCHLVTTVSPVVGEPSTIALAEIKPGNSGGVEVVGEPVECVNGVLTGEPEASHVRARPAGVVREGDPIPARRLAPGPAYVPKLTPLPIDRIAWGRLWYVEKLEVPKRPSPHEKPG